MFLVAKYYYANNDLRRAHTRKSRYAVWSPLKDKPGHMIIEVGNDLTHLQQKYNISDNLVFKFLK